MRNKIKGDIKGEENIDVSDLLGPVVIYKEDCQLKDIYDIPVNMVTVKYTALYASFQSNNPLQPHINHSVSNLWVAVNEQLNVM
jgi:hypothetical protein